MKQRNLLFHLVLAASFLLLAAGAPGTAQQSANIITYYNTTSAYVAQVNQSTYLIFKPNLTQAYIYLDQANTLLSSNTTNTTRVAQLLQSASASATTAQQKIYGYRTLSAVVMIILTIIVAFVLYKQMKPIAQQRNRIKRVGKKRA